MKFEIKNRWTGAIKFTAEIEATEETSYRIKVGLAARWAIEHDANLTDANLTDANLTDADLTDANLTDANLTDADLTDANLTDANLTDANLTRADLTRANLTRANLTDANLTRANLTDANLTDANLTGLTVPVIKNIDAQILAMLESGGKLNMGTWHSCETTHCRAGWACVIAGYAGGVLEGKTCAATAGRLIYEASRPGIPAPNFYAEDEEALEDIKKCAAEQLKAK